MKTDCNSKQLQFQALGTRKVVADFDGGTITSDAGALLLREIEAANHFFDDFASCFVDHREQGYVEHSVKELIAQRTIGLCLGYEDTNDAQRLCVDRAMRHVVGERAKDKTAGSVSQMGRFETEILSQPQNLKVLMNQPGKWVDQVHQHTPVKEVILDMDSSDSPTFGRQEGSAYNGHFGYTCYHPLFLFN